MQLVHSGRSSAPYLSQYLRRYASNESKDGFRRFMQTIRVETDAGFPSPSSWARAPATIVNTRLSQAGPAYDVTSRWSLHSLPDPSRQPLRRSRAQKYKRRSALIDEKTPSMGTNTSETNPSNIHESKEPLPLALDSEVSTEIPTVISTDAASSAMPAPISPSPLLPTTNPAPKKRRPLRPRKALITLSPTAVSHLKLLLDLPTPQFIRIGVRNRGCSGLSYHLEYVTEPGSFDERIDQDGATVLIDSKALFSIVGSEMDWLDDKLSSRFIFKNPNSKGTCGCGESFMV